MMTELLQLALSISVLCNCWSIWSLNKALKKAAVNYHTLHIRLSMLEQDGIKKLFGDIQGLSEMEIAGRPEGIKVEK